MKVYLAGPIAGCTDAEANGWRQQARRFLTRVDPTVHVLDPMVRDYRNAEVAAWEVVAPDKADILASDVVVANCTRASVGTSMEVLYAWERGMRVLVIHAGTPSPWLVAHSEGVFRTVAGACGAVLRQPVRG